MPRKARVLVAGCPHHIVQRAHNREVVFLVDEDCQFYLENLLECKEKLAIMVYGWCLMTNHVHLIMEPCKKPEGLSMRLSEGRECVLNAEAEGDLGVSGNKINPL